MKNRAIFSSVFLSCALAVYPVGRFVFKPIQELDARLEGLEQSAIVDTKCVHIPGFPKAFNPSLITYADGYLLSFRIRHRAKRPTAKTRKKDVSFIGVVKLDAKFRVIGTPQLLDVISYSSRLSLTAEDARLFKMGERIYCIFNDLPSPGMGGHAVYLAELNERKGRFVFKEPVKSLSYERARPIEKNWSPFVTDDKLYLIYSDAPRVILQVDLDSGHCTEMVRMECEWKWKWGEIRGGTPALPVGDHLLTFFHSSVASTTGKGRLYVMGAYIFDRQFPFAPREVSSVPLGTREDYIKENKHQVVFPGGLVIQEDRVHVAWGKNNKQVCVTTFDKQKLLSSL